MSAAELERGLRRAVPWLWLATSLVWAVVIVVTDEPAWPLALWVAATVGPVAYLGRSKNRSEPRGSNTKGTQE